MSLKKYPVGQKLKVINKAKEIRSLVRIGLPTTCAYNIICDSSLQDTTSLSSHFIMFDFAMPLGNKKVHKFFPWTFFHWTALPILIFNDGRVHVSNDEAKAEHCAVVLAWGDEGGRPESSLNTNMKSPGNNELNLK